MPASAPRARPHVGHRRAGADLQTVDGDFAEAAAKPDHHAGNAAVAHDQIGAERR